MVCEPPRSASWPDLAAATKGQRGRAEKRSPLGAMGAGVSKSTTQRERSASSRRSSFSGWFQPSGGAEEREMQDRVISQVRGKNRGAAQRGRTPLVTARPSSKPVSGDGTGLAAVQEGSIGRGVARQSPIRGLWVGEGLQSMDLAGEAESSLPS